MTVENPTSGLLSSLTDALQAAASAFAEPEEAFLPPSDGISLLDIKNDLLLSYIQNLVFLIVLKLRNGSARDESGHLSSEVTNKLDELRVYLERGVRPLEGKLKYQIDKAVRAADEVDRRAAQKASAKAESKKPTTKELAGDVSEEFESSEGGSDKEDADVNDPDAWAGPRRSALQKNIEVAQKETTGSKSRSTATGAYKPPRITPTAMPQPPSQHDRDSSARRRKSHLLDEYIDEELSAAPRAQPSIGTGNTIVKHGRGAMSSRDREKERERTEYEERNFVRLPGESKAEKKKARLRGEGNKRDLFGGEDWTGLGGLGDRINRTVAGRSRNEGSSVLERRQKRGRDTQDGPRGDGLGIGESFEKKRKIMQQRAEKKARRRG
jgi:U3 small nucleolar ribonucleoprotein protein LCP5